MSVATVLKEFTTCILEYSYSSFCILKYHFFFQKQVDINAAVQALIESNAALQMEVIYFNVFTLSYRLCNYNSIVWGQNKASLQRLNLKWIMYSKE